MAKDPGGALRDRGRARRRAWPGVAGTRLAPLRVVRAGGRDRCPPPPPRRRGSPPQSRLLVVLAAAGAVAAVLATRGSSGRRSAHTRPQLRATVLAIEHILRESAVERHSVGGVLDAGFHCRISRSEASSRMKERGDEPPTGARTTSATDRHAARGGDAGRRAARDSRCATRSRPTPTTATASATRHAGPVHRRAATSTPPGRRTGRRHGEDPVRGGVQSSGDALRPSGHGRRPRFETRRGGDRSSGVRRCACAARAAARTAPRPRIVVKPIPFGAGPARRDGRLRASATTASTAGGSCTRT